MGRGPEVLIQDVTDSMKEIEEATRVFRWLHLPANNVIWAMDLMKRINIERRTMEDNSWGPVSPVRIDWSEQQHRGYLPHSVFMRPELMRVGVVLRPYIYLTSIMRPTNINLAWIP